MLTSTYNLEDICINLHEINLFDNFEIGNEDFNSFIEKCKFIIRNIIEWFKKTFKDFCNKCKQWYINYCEWLSDKSNALEKIAKEISKGFESLDKYEVYKYELNKFHRWCKETKVKFVNHEQLYPLAELSDALNNLLQNSLTNKDILVKLVDNNNSCHVKDTFSFLVDNNYLDVSNINADIIKSITKDSKDYTYMRPVKDAFRYLLEKVDLYDIEEMTPDNLVNCCYNLISVMKDESQKIKTVYSYILDKLNKNISLSISNFNLSSLNGKETVGFRKLLPAVQSICAVLGTIIYRNTICQYNVHRQICEKFIDNIKEVRYNKEDVYLSYIKEEIYNLINVYEEIYNLINVYNVSLGKIANSNYYYFNIKEFNNIINNLPVSKNFKLSIQKYIDDGKYAPFSIADISFGVAIFVSNDFLQDIKNTGSDEILQVILYHELGHVCNLDNFTKLTLERKNNYNVKGPMLDNYKNIKNILDREYKADQFAVNYFGYERVIEALEWSLNIMIK